MYQYVKQLQYLMHTSINDTNICIVCAKDHVKTVSNFSKRLRADYLKNVTEFDKSQLERTQ